MPIPIIDHLASGQLARLIPVVADSKKEERATSILLASFMAVPIFAKKVLEEAGAPIGKKSKIRTYTEVIFKTTEDKKTSRPDGLIVVSSGSKQWTALIESKVGNAALTVEQIEEYLDLAKAQGIDALITISNQFATTPLHHPIKISKNKLRHTELYHFSWLALKSKALLLTNNKKVEDPEQAYILSELIRYLDHESSGVAALSRFPSEWKELCNLVQRGNTLSKTTSIVERSVASWHQLLRHLALELSMRVKQPVKITLSRAREKDAALNFSEDCSCLCRENHLEATFEVPNAAARINLVADCLRRTINISMKLDAPKDKTRASTVINWLTKQLKNKEINNIGVRAYWPKRIQMTSASLSEILANPASLIQTDTKELPTHLEIIRVIDLSTKFKGPRSFVEECTRQFPEFYEDIGQHLSKWTAKAPQVKKEEHSEDTEIPNIFSNPETTMNNELTTERNAAVDSETTGAFSFENYSK